MKKGTGVLQRRSIRLPAYDYSQTGAYFVTICSYGKRCIFGEVRQGMMMLSDTGRIVEIEWVRTEELRPTVLLDEFIFMPNHFHAILMIDEAACRGTACRAPSVEHFGKPVSGSVPTILRAFKAASTRAIHIERKTPGRPVWQRNFHEHVIRDENSLNRIREYISTNSMRWELDRENPRRHGTDDFDRWLDSFRRTRPE